MVFSNDDHLSNSGGGSIDQQESGANSQPMRCLADCGYFGSPQFQGYCSQCYVLCEIAQLNATANNNGGNGGGELAMNIAADEQQQTPNNNNYEDVTTSLGPVNEDSTSQSLPNNEVTCSSDVFFGNNQNIQQDHGASIKPIDDINDFFVTDTNFNQNELSTSNVNQSNKPDNQMALINDVVSNVIGNQNNQSTNLNDSTNDITFQLNNPEDIKFIDRLIQIDEQCNQIPLSNTQGIENHSSDPVNSLVNTTNDAHTAASLMPSTSIINPNLPSTVAPHQSNQPNDNEGSAPSQRKEQTRCGKCKAKLKLTDLECVCGLRFCWKHRFGDSHECTYDYKSKQRQKLSKDITKVAPRNIKDF